MERHVRTLGILNIAFGVAGGVCAIALLVLMDGFAGLLYWAEGSGGFGFLVTGSVVFHLIVAVPCVLGGIFLLQYREWARLLMIFVSALNVLNVPFGAALGAFGLWVLLQPETEPLFLDPVLRAAIWPAKPGSGRVPSSIKPARTNLPE